MNLQLVGSTALLVIGSFLILILLPGVDIFIGAAFQRRSLRSQVLGRSSRIAIRLFGVLFIIVGLLLSFENFISPSDLDQGSLTQFTNRQEIIQLQKDPYHIGDTEFKVRLNEAGEVIEKYPFDHPAPEANPFEADFSLTLIPSEIILNITARDIDPDKASSPVEIRVNGQLVDYLNRYYKLETMTPSSVSITINPKYVHKGLNTLLIFVKPTKTEYGVLNLDDIEFWDVELNLK
jgi:hypothetical protein